MKCPECGEWNRASLPHCSRCGTPLNIDAASRVGWKDSLKDNVAPPAYLRADEFGQVQDARDRRDVLAREMQEFKQRKAEGAALQRRLRQSVQPVSEETIVEEVIPHPASAGAAQAPGATLRLRRVASDQEASERDRVARHMVRFLDDENRPYLDTRTYDPVYQDSESLSRDSLPSSSRVPLVLPARMRRRRFLLRTLLTLAVLALLTAGGIYGWRYLSALRRAGLQDSSAIVTASMLDDVAAHTILIPGEDGTSIYIRELHASYTVVDGFATVEVADHTWYDNLESVQDETMNVTLTPFLKTSSGQQTPMAPISYDISIPLSPIRLESPDALRTTVSTTMAAIRIVVRPGSRVTVNGTDYSDTVSSESGEMSYNATVQPIGDNVYHIVVRSQYCRENSLTVTLYRAPQEVPLDLAVGTYGSTDKASMPVSATTLPGADITVLTPHSDLNITDLDSTGKFSFNAVFSKIGNNTISIVASYPGKKPSQVDHTVYYLPPPNEYTVKAWGLDAANYSELLSNMQVRAERNQVYVVTGVVQYSVSEKPQMVVINTSEDGKSQPVLLENYSKVTWQVGTYYRIYADAYSTYNGMPWLNARYTYPK